MNKFLAQFIENAKRMWAGLAAGPRVTLISFVGCAVLLIVGLAVWSTQTNYVLLYGGLSPEDAAAVTAQLRDDKILYQYESSRGTILVASSKVEIAKLNLAGKGLPKNLGGGSDGVGFEIFDKPSFGTTDFQNKVNMLRAMEGKASRTIKGYEGVDNARVTLTVPEDDVLSRDRQESKASVMVTMRGNRSLSAETVGAIQHTVASSVPKLDPRNVTVTDSTGRLLSRSPSANDPGSMSDEQLSMQKNVEQHYIDKVQRMLDRVLGLGNSAVSVTAQLNLDRIDRTSNRMDPASGVILWESTKKDESTNTSSANAGVPGVTSNTPGSTAGAGASPGKGSTTKHTDINNNYHYDTITEKIIQQPGSVKRLSVSVFVNPKSKPAEAAPTAAAGAAPAPAVPAAPTARTKTEIDELTASISKAVGLDTARQDTISVTEMPFEAPVLMASAVSGSSAALDLVQSHISDILAFAGVMLMAYIFWRMFSRLSVPVPVVTAARKAIAAIAEADDMGQVRNQTVALHEEVKQLVTENNTQAVSLIRSMIR